MLTLAPMRAFVRPLGMTIALLLASMPSYAAEGRTSSLSWLRMPGADGCIATQALARAVEDRLGRTVFVSAAQADLSVEGRIEKKGASGWHAVITMRDGSGAPLGTRELDRDGATCDVMNEPLALILAVMIDPDAAMRPKTKPEPPVSVPAPVPVPVPPAAVPPPAEEPYYTPPQKEPWRFEGLVGGHVVTGLAPAAAFGAGVTGILYPPDLAVGFRGTAALFLPTTAEGNGARATVDLVYLGGALCPTLRGKVNFMTCVGGQLGVLRPHAETAGVREEVLGLVNVTAELRMSAMLAPPIGVGLGVGGLVPILRPSVESPQGTLHHVSVVGLTADVGFGFFFP